MKKTISLVLVLCVFLSLVLTGCSQERVKTNTDTEEKKTLLKCLSQPSYIYNNDLALICAHLSQEIENVYASKSTSKIKNEYVKLGVKQDNIYTLSDCYESYYYSLACMKDVTIKKEKYNILFITARGTGGDMDKSWDEKTADAYAESNSDFFEYEDRIYDDSYHFYNKIQKGIEDKFLNTHPFLKTGKLKVVITGHSLGGSGVNLVAAAFDKCLEGSEAWWSDLTTKDDIFCYTFGGIGCVDLDYGEGTNSSSLPLIGNIDPDKIYDYSIINGYENIHNVYSYYDSYGPRGNLPLTVKNRNATYYNKFGHVELFGNNDYWSRTYNDDVAFETTQHSMATYIDALNDHETSGLSTCNDEKQPEEIVEPEEPEEVEESEEDNYINDDSKGMIIGKWKTNDGAVIEFCDDGSFSFDWGFGVEETGEYSLGDSTGENSFEIDLQGTSIIYLMKNIYGSALDDYHFEILIKDENNISLVQVYGDYTAESSKCRLNLSRAE